MHDCRPACSRSQQAEQQPAAGLLPQHFLIGEGVSLSRITERPFVLGRCPGSDTRWRLHPSGSARRRLDRARSSRPATTKATWRSVDPEKRWVLPGVAAMLSRLHVVASGGQGAGAGHRLISHSRGCQLPHCPRMGEARVDTGAAGGLLTAGDLTF